MNQTGNPSMDGNFLKPDDEIQLSSETGAKVPQPSELIELLQVNHLRSLSAHYTIFDGRFLSVHQKRSWKRPRRYWLDLGFLDPTPHLLTITDWRSLYIAGGLGIATLFMILLSSFVSQPWHEQPWLPATVALGCASLIAVGAHFLRSCSLVRFHSISGDAVFLEMHSNSPSRAEFSAFLRKLIQHVQLAHRHDPRKPYQKLGAELCEHRRLLEKGVLDQDAYDYAREKILRKHRQAHTRSAKQKQLKQTRHNHEDADIIEVTLAGGSWQVEKKKSA